jgi:hypothetical protein
MAELKMNDKEIELNYIILVYYYFNLYLCEKQ